MHAQLLSSVWLFETLLTVAPTRLLYPWVFPGNRTGVGCHFFFRGLSDPGIKPASPALAGGFFTAETSGKTLEDWKLPTNKKWALGKGFVPGKALWGPAWFHFYQFHLVLLYSWNTLHKTSSLFEWCSLSLDFLHIYSPSCLKLKMSFKILILFLCLRIIPYYLMTNHWYLESDLMNIFSCILLNTLFYKEIDHIPV